MTAKRRKLTVKQERFCQEYLVDCNATQAAIRAKYSKHTAGAIGKENLQKPLIAAKIGTLLSEQQYRTEISADAVIQEFGKFAFGNADCGSADQLRALENLGRHFGIFNDKLVHQFDFTARSDDELHAIVDEGA